MSLVVSSYFLFPQGFGKHVPLFLILHSGVWGFGEGQGSKLGVPSLSLAAKGWG